MLYFDRMRAGYRHPFDNCRLGRRAKDAIDCWEKKGRDINARAWERIEKNKAKLWRAVE